MELTREVQQQLVAPFDASVIDVRAGATNSDKSRALALPYADARAYQQRLDEVCGPACWSVSYRRLSERAIVCRLTICGVVREDVGECADTKNENFWTVASAQAFKRACAAFGLGRYLYSLPTVWAEYDSQRKAFKNPRRVVADILGRAELAISTQAYEHEQPAAPVVEHDPERRDLIARVATQRRCNPSKLVNVETAALRRMLA